jgi:hypothetical protein
MLFGIALFCVFGSLFLYLAYLVGRDAGRRGKSPLLVCLLVFLCFPLGALIWLVFHPEIVDDNKPPHRFRLEDHRVQ